MVSFLYPRIANWSCRTPLPSESQKLGSLLRIASGPISLELGPATCFPEGGGPAAGADDAPVAFTTFGVFAFTFAAVLSKAGYADADSAAASAGFGAGDFEGFGDLDGFGDFAGFGVGASFTFDFPRRLAASTCISLGGGASSLGGGAGLPTRPGVLDLAFDFGAGSDAGRGTLGFIPALRLIVASRVSFGKNSGGVCFVGIGGCVISTFSGAGEVVFPAIRFRSDDIWRKKPPRYVVFCAA